MNWKPQLTKCLIITINNSNYYLSTKSPFCYLIHDCKHTTDYLLWFLNGILLFLNTIYFSNEFSNHMQIL